MHKYKLKDLLVIKNGSDYRHLSQGNIPVYGSGGLMCYVNKPMSTKPSILLPRKGTLDNIMYVETPFWTVDTMYWTEVNDNIVEPYYLYNYLKVLRFDGIRSGSTLPSMTSSAYYDIPIILPHYEKQKKIANILKYLDNKIELNNKINKELEQMAKTLYEYWFVQFDFPDEKGRPYKSANGKMVYNEVLKREIPVGWEVKNISSYCNIIDCLHSKKPDYHYEDDKCYLLQLENLTENGYINISSKYYISKKDYIYWTQKLEIKENDFVFTNAGRAGAFGKIPANIQCALGRNFTAIRPLHISPYYLRMYFASNDMKQQILSNLDCGAFFKSFNVKSIKLINLLLPKTSVLDTFVNQISPIIKKIEANNGEIQQLTNFRDFLLPLLMNGQVSVQN